MESDHDIREHLAAGRDRVAFELLLACYQRKVFHLAWSTLGDESAAEELAQDVFIRIWKALHGYRGEASLSTWTFAITRNLCLTRRRALRSHAVASMEEPGVLAAVETKLRADSRSAPEAGVGSMLALLTPQYRQALTLFYLEEKSYEEVAAMMGVPIGTVRTYLHRGRKQLAELFAERPLHHDMRAV